MRALRLLWKRLFKRCSCRHARCFLSSLFCTLLQGSSNKVRHTWTQHPPCFLSYARLQGQVFLNSRWKTRQDMKLLFS